jgi:ubiquinone/menaquinone biosynthesis C-methylase UbiE
MLDSVARFTVTVGDYVKYRPGYPIELFRYLASQFSNNVDVAELGAGTGIFTRQLANVGFVRKIYAVEPNDNMRSAAEKERNFGEQRIVYRKGTAENTGLPSHSVDGVLGAQCFHWFDLGLTLAEINRIAKPGSNCYAIWNDRVNHDFNNDLERVLFAFSKPYPSLKRPDGTILDLKRLIPSGEEITFESNQEMDLRGLIGRMASTSYVAHGVADKISFNNELAKIFEKYQKGGKVIMEYKTRVFHWRTPSTSNQARL